MSEAEIEILGIVLCIAIVVAIWAVNLQAEHATSR